MDNQRKRISKKTREIVHQKFGGRCAYCGEKIVLMDMQVDHLIPVYKDGEKRVENYMPACRQCNFYKGTYTLEDFRRNLELIPHNFTVPNGDKCELYAEVNIPKKPVKEYYYMAERCVDVRPFLGETENLTSKNFSSLQKRSLNPS